MKKSVLITALAVLLSFTINAQTSSKPVILHAQEIMDELKLNAEQQTKIREIKKLTDPQIKAAKENTSHSPEEIKRELVKIYAERKKMQYEVLTTEQLEKLKQMIADSKKGK